MTWSTPDSGEEKEREEGKGCTDVLSSQAEEGRQGPYPCFGFGIRAGGENGTTYERIT